MSPELEYFEQFHFWARLSAWLTGKTNWKIRRSGMKLRKRLYLTYPVHHWPVEIEGSVRAISMKAIRFATLTPPREGEVIDLKVNLPDELGGEVLTLKGRVSKVMVPPGRRRYRVGCEMVDLNGSAREKLNEFIQWNFTEAACA